VPRVMSTCAGNCPTRANKTKIFKSLNFLCWFDLTSLYTKWRHEQGSKKHGDKDGAKCTHLVLDQFNTGKLQRPHQIAGK
jgi:hypothetical protein